MEPNWKDEYASEIRKKICVTCWRGDKADCPGIGEWPRWESGRWECTVKAQGLCERRHKHERR